MTDRVVQKVLAAHEDLALGQGTETQTRNGVGQTVTKIDLAFVVASLADLQALDTSRYFHATLDTSTQTLYYRFDILSAEVVDSYNYVAPLEGSGQWVLIQDVRNVFVPTTQESNSQDVASGTLTATSSVVLLRGQGDTTDTLNRIRRSPTVDGYLGDKLTLIYGGTGTYVITINDVSGGGNNVRTRSGSAIVFTDTTTATDSSIISLIFDGTDWVQT